MHNKDSDWEVSVVRVSRRTSIIVMKCIHNSYWIFVSNLQKYLFQSKKEQ